MHVTRLPRVPLLNGKRARKIDGATRMPKRI
jgi:hypothetical protein